MRVSLEETLRLFCDEIGWSYAVFWRTRSCGNARHLVWLEGHCKEHISRFVEKTMKSKIHVAGEGIMGLSVMTGIHQWMINDGDGCRSKVLGGMGQHFSMGIMTIVVIPILPHGVVQLGSTQMIPEDLAFVKHVQLRFLHVDLCSGTLLHGDRESGLSEYPILNSKSLTKTAFPGSSFSSSQITSADSCYEKLKSGFLQASTSTILEDKAFEDGCKPRPIRETQSSSSSSGISKGAKMKLSSEMPIMALTTDNAPQLVGNELLDISGLEFKANQWFDILDSPTSTALRNWDSVFDPLQDLISSPDQLLDAIVSKVPGNVMDSLEDDFSSRSTMETTMMKGSLVDASLAMISDHFHDHERGGECCGTTSICRTQVSSLGDKGWCNGADGDFRIEDAGKSTRKRPRAGDGPRPRPKDRQMIQDRVKELREIVPNGAKCSIDALLERTIRHMLFLQSVTKHADMLKETGEPKIIDKEGGLLMEDKFDGGTTWAFEVGSRPPVCPIIVEDLLPPRQLLVEMLCEERGFFLEIADIIRGLGLTILKGVMEARKDKVWARFAVEANRDVTRMDIFMSLMRLLEPTAVTSSPMISNASIVGKAICKSSMPVNSASECLQ